MPILTDCEQIPPAEASFTIEQHPGLTKDHKFSDQITITTVGTDIALARVEKHWFRIDAKGFSKANALAQAAFRYATIYLTETNPHKGIQRRLVSALGNVIISDKARDVVIFTG